MSLLYTAVEVVTPTRNPQTVFQVLAPSGQRVEILGVDVGLRGSGPATEPILFDWVTQTTAGTASSLTPRKQDRGLDESIQATLSRAFTAEPTTGLQLPSFTLHQQSTAFWRPPGGPIICKGEERVGFRYRSATFVEVVLTFHMKE